MENDLLILKALHRLIELHEEMLVLMKTSPSSVSKSQLQSLEANAELLTRQEVQEYLSIGETTYKRKVKEGVLKPMKMPGGDRFYKHELDAAFKESIRRGRI